MLAEQACSLAMGDSWLEGSSLVVQGVSTAMPAGIELLQQGRQIVHEVGDDLTVGIALVMS